MAAPEGDLLPSVDALVAQFDAVAMGHEHGAREPMIRKWAKAPPDMAVFTSPAFDVRPYIAQVSRQFAEVAQLTGLDMHLERPSAATNLRYGFYSREDFSKLPGDPNDPDYRQVVLGSACLGVSQLDRDAKGTIVGGAILIGTDIAEPLRRHCMLEELVQMMGLPNDACQYRPSLFCEEDYEMDLTPADVILLKTLYDPRLAAGTPREKALPVVRRLVTALRGDLLKAGVGPMPATAYPPKPTGALNHEEEGARTPPLQAMATPR
jgi:hypothetical protein